MIIFSLCLKNPESIIKTEGEVTTMTTVGKKLYRLPEQGKITGVCAGLADYFDIDVTLMRVIFVVLAFATQGALVLGYLILAVVMPVSRSTDKHRVETSGGFDDRIEQLGVDLKNNNNVTRLRNYLGFGLIIFGVWLLLGQFFPYLLGFRWDYIWPVLIILAGILIATRRKE